MPLTVDVTKVQAVLLPDGWYLVDDYSLSLFPFYRDPDTGVSVEGFDFRNSGTRVAGPMNSMVAVRYDNG